jgi:hypothetical protein
MKDLLLTWSDAGKGGNIRSPEWGDIEAKLIANLGGAGVIGVEGETADGLGRSIQVRFEDGKYLLTFGYETDGDWIVRMYQNGESRSDEITLLGDVWRSNCVCRDPAIVRQAFNQFFDTGTVSDVLMNA